MVLCYSAEHFARRDGLNEGKRLWCDCNVPRDNEAAQLLDIFSWDWPVHGVEETDRWGTAQSLVVCSVDKAAGNKGRTEQYRAKVFTGKLYQFKMPIKLFVSPKFLILLSDHFIKMTSKWNKLKHFNLTWIVASKIVKSNWQPILISIGLVLPVVEIPVFSDRVDTSLNNRKFYWKTFQT